MKRKILSMLLCGTMIAALLSGCGASSEPADAGTEAVVVEETEEAAQTEEAAEE